MNQLVTPKTHTEPADYRGPFDPVRAAIRTTGHSTWCHRCDESTIPDLVHLANTDGQPLCPACGRLLGVALRRGLLALNQLAHVLRQPSAHPAVVLVWDCVPPWRSPVPRRSSSCGLPRSSSPATSATGRPASPQPRSPHDRPPPLHRPDADVLRHHMRAGAHPARSVPCGHCGAREHQTCTTPSKRHTLPEPHPRRIADWARTTARCPECQVEPGITCRTPAGLPTATVHDRRVQEAQETCA